LFSCSPASHFTHPGVGALTALTTVLSLGLAKALPEQ